METSDLEKLQAILQLLAEMDEPKVRHSIKQIMFEIVEAMDTIKYDDTN